MNDIEENITPGALYTLGYHEPDAGSRLSHLMSDPKTLLIDIRSHARAPWSPTWTKKALKGAYGERYVHILDLGNVNYHDPHLPIHLLKSREGDCAMREPVRSRVLPGALLCLSGRRTLSPQNGL